MFDRTYNILEEIWLHADRISSLLSPWPPEQTFELDPFGPIVPASRIIQFV